LDIFKIRFLFRVLVAHAIILATQEAAIRIAVPSQPGQIVPETLIQKCPSQKWAGGVAQGVGSEFKSQYHKKKKGFFNYLPGLALN
jgi:hypothetical protein